MIPPEFTPAESFTTPEVSLSRDKVSLRAQADVTVATQRQCAPRPAVPPLVTKKA
jgi:hypothetical protein